MNIAFNKYLLSSILCISSCSPLTANNDGIKTILFYGSIGLGTASLIRTAKTFFTLKQTREKKFKKVNERVDLGNDIFNLAEDLLGRKSKTIASLKKGADDAAQECNNEYREKFSYKKIVPDALFSTACFGTAALLYYTNK